MPIPKTIAEMVGEIQSAIQFTDWDDKQRFAVETITANAAEIGRRVEAAFAAMRGEA